MNSRSLAKSADKIKSAILGKSYVLSLVFCNNTLAKKLNRIYRSKDKPANVLAFPLSKNSGEIFINKQGLGNFSELELFVHALLHLKGMRHGAKMEGKERQFLKIFNGKTNLRRRGHRYSSS